jgi:hypothetical protein
MEKLAQMEAKSPSGFLKENDIKMLNVTAAESAARALMEKYLGKDVEMKNGGKAKLENLFHGTRATPPTMIYMSEEGFNLNFSKEGMWGKANYFAFKSSYSNSYASVRSNGKR